MQIVLKFLFCPPRKFQKYAFDLMSLMLRSIVLHFISIRLIVENILKSNVLLSQCALSTSHRRLKATARCSCTFVRDARRRNRNISDANFFEYKKQKAK